MMNDLARRFLRFAKPDTFASLRFLDESSETVSFRRGVLEPVRLSNSKGAMITVIERNGGLGYAATSDVSESGLSRALEQASAWARRTGTKSVTNFFEVRREITQGGYESPVRVAWDSISLREKADWLEVVSQRLCIDSKIVDWEASLTYIKTDALYISNRGTHINQRFHQVIPYFSATANEGAVTQLRSLGGRGVCRQGGYEVIHDLELDTLPQQIAEEALSLLRAPQCPSGAFDLLLAPDQMILQIHESIGHPIELDRILGDERNYAGSSFVTTDMFGSYRYGSELLNITYDPTRQSEFASFAFDDDGSKAERAFLIRNGILERPLGSSLSQARAGLEGVANARASSWNRPPIDRMANLNLEAGNSSLEEMIGSVESGIYMKTNSSWSIDDTRNKFQFGCEWAQKIEHGRLTEVVRNPCYRGTSATFWRNLKAVGNEDTVDVLGTPYCGKGEPNQVIRVGHASPACLFANVDVFGGA